MRILKISYEYPPLGGGGARVVFGLSRELVRLGHEIDIVTMGYEGLNSLERLNGITVHRLRPTRRDNIVCHTSEMIRHELQAIPFIHRLIRRNSYDLNHSHFIFPDGLSALAMKMMTGLRYIITAHGSDVPNYNPDRFTIEHKSLAYMWRLVVGNADCVVCPSEHLRSLVLAKRKSTRTCVIPNGMDLEKFNPGRQKRPQMLVVTRMLRRKGVQNLLKAVKDWDLPYEIHIVGDGPYLPKLRELAVGSAARIRFWGWLENDSKELKDLYETSSTFVFLSSSENFPINLLEAMASGMSIVTNAASGCEEVVGDSALKVDPTSPEQVRNALSYLLGNQNLSRELGRQARMRFEDRFTWPAIAAQYDSLYQELAHSSQRQRHVFLQRDRNQSIREKVP